MWKSLLLLLFLILPTAVFAAGTVERFPPPQFTVPHEKPVETFTDAKEKQDAFALGVFAACMVVATILVFVVRKRWVILAFAGCMLLLWGFLRSGCVCAPGAMQNIVLGILDPHYMVTYFLLGLFALPLLFAFFFGRTFCSGVCPLGAVQELTAFFPKKVPHWLEHTLGIFPYIYLGLTILLVVTGTVFLICTFDPYVVLFHREGNPGMVAFLVAMLILGMFVARPYCRYLCPYGALLRLAGSVSRWNIRTTAKNCENCHLCADACPYNAILPPTVAPSPRDHVRGRYRLGLLLLITPFVVGLGYACGGLLGLGISGVHPLIQREAYLALVAEKDAVADGDVIAEEMTAGSPHRTDEVAWTQRAVEFQGIPAEKIREDAVRARTRFYVGGKWLGAWIGLVFCGKLIQVSTRRRRTEYEIDPARCVCCGRCFAYCPNDRPHECPNDGTICIKIQEKSV